MEGRHNCVPVASPIFIKYVIRVLPLNCNHYSYQMN